MKSYMQTVEGGKKIKQNKTKTTENGVFINEMDEHVLMLLLMKQR